MCALPIAVSLLIGGALWLWSLHGGAALEPRTAARIFGWLCVASIAISAFCLQRRTSAFARPSAGPATALVTTLLTGAAVLYLSYFAWPAPISVAAAEQASPGARAAFAPPAKAERKRPPIRVSTARSAAKPAAGPCAGLKGLAEYQCRRCGNETGLFGFLCQENARGEYCAGRDGREPGCPWARSAAAN